MTEEEFNGFMSRHRLAMPAILQLMWMKTGAVISSDHIRTHFTRYGALSPAMTAAFRLLFKQLERDHEAIGS